MSSPSDRFRESEDADEMGFAMLLGEQRPTPTPLFRGALGRRIASIDPGYDHRPAKLWWWASFAIVAGVVLVALGALVSIGLL